jgi:HK97 family phage major capsid protein
MTELDKKELATESLAEVKEMNLKQGEEIEMLKKAQAERPAAKKSLTEVVKDAYTKGLESWKEQGKKGMVEVELNLKAISDTNITGDIPQAMRELGINKTPKEGVIIRSLVFNGTTDSPVVDWIEKVSETGVPIFLAELDSFPEEETNYEVFTSTVKKIGGMTKVSEEKLEDIDWMMNEIRAELIERHDIVVDNQILAGNGAGNNLLGIIPQATAFTPSATFSLNVADPNKSDVLRVAIAQIRAAEFNANVIVLHPDEVASMELEKAGDGHYILPPFRAADGLTVKGVRVVESTKIALDNFLVMDASKAGVFVRRQPRLEIGFDQDDFSTDKRTVKLSERMAFRIKGRDLQAFVTGNFTAALAAILKP